MTDYVKCPTCGAICTVEGAPDFPGDDAPVTMHYAPACGALVREMAGCRADIARDRVLAGKFAMMYYSLARALVEAMDGDSAAKQHVAKATVLSAREVSGDQSEQYGEHVREVELRVLVPADAALDPSRIKVILE